MAEVSLHKLNKKFDLSHVVKDVERATLRRAGVS